MQLAFVATTAPLGISTYSIKRAKTGSLSRVEYLNEKPPADAKYESNFQFHVHFISLYTGGNLFRDLLLIHVFFISHNSPAFDVKRGRSEDILIRNSQLEATFDAGVGLLRVSCFIVKKTPLQTAILISI